jgi:hypothetical protein
MKKPVQMFSADALRLPADLIGTAGLPPEPSPGQWLATVGLMGRMFADWRKDPTRCCGPMTPQELRSIREGLGLSLVGLSDALGLHRSTAAK